AARPFARLRCVATGQLFSRWPEREGSSLAASAPVSTASRPGCDPQDATLVEDGAMGSRRVVRLVTILGARPQFVKAFPLSRTIHAARGFEEVVVHTGQHFDHKMSDIFFAELEIEPPRYFLNIH